MQHTTWMEPQSTQGGNNQHTTNQETNNLKRVNEGGVKGHCSILHQLKDKSI